MAKQVIGIGTTANDGTGDQVRVAFDKTNQNFTELYDSQPNNSDDILEGTTNKYLLDNSVTYEKVSPEFKSTTALTPAATINVDFGASAIFTLTPTTTSTLNIQNPAIGSSKILLITGSGTGSSILFSLEGGSGVFNKINGDYDDTSAIKNFIQITCVSSTEFWYSISQIA